MQGPHTHLARVRLVKRDTEREQELHEVLAERAPEIDEANPNLFFWDAEISNNLLDSHFTRMSDTTLLNYAEDAERGVAFLKGHDWRSLPIGYSLRGELEEDQDRTKVVAGFYTVRGLGETNDLIARIEARILRDVSVGFHGGTTTCDICGRDIWDWDCRHIPGLMYEEEKDGRTETVLSTFTIDDARLSEVSGVYDGSTPEATIRKATGLAEAGELNQQHIRVLEDRYRIALPAKKSFAVNGVNYEEAPEENRSEEVTEEIEVQVAKVRSLLGIKAGDDLSEGVQKLTDSLAEAKERISELEPRAKEGEQYRKDLIEDALAEGVRAQGKDFDLELYGATLNDAPLPVVKRMRDDWKRIADQVLPAGRTTQDESKTQVERKSVHPDSAYA